MDSLLRSAVLVIASVAIAQTNPLKLCVTISGDNGFGSGFIINHDGAFYVVTNNHVIWEINKPVIRKVNGEIIHFSRVLSGTDRDIALIPIETTYFTDALEIEEHDDDIWVNESLTCFGDSEGRGIIVACNGKFLGLGATSLETDALFVPGNSGGPIIRDKTHKVIGIATFIAPLDNPQWWTVGTRFANEKGNAARRFAVRLDNLDWGTLDSYDYSEIQEAWEALMTALSAKGAEGKSMLTWELVQLYCKASHGDMMSQYWLGRCFLVLNDYESAVKWFRLSAEQGYSEAQFTLGRCY
ncbi:MAG: bifunctional trypsin-like peptidase domain-containing/SEL1-like repeat protein, partial [Victivallales bacterium]|nr:bifunctional trypsin-like peptidase domain-containing/SEL1-like repeat protein [Victivallales bacterium]